MAGMNRPALVESIHKSMRSLITRNPTNATLDKLIEELKKYGVTTEVRVCEAIYDTTLVEKESNHVFDWPFDDGAPPSNQIVNDYLNIVKVKLREEPGCRIAVHCVAGCGRAPGLVALALVEGGMKYEDLVQFKRQKWCATFNSKQLLYLEKYRPQCGCAVKTPWVTGTTAACRKTGMPGATASDMQLEAGPGVVHGSPCLGLVNKSNEASVGAFKAVMQATHKRDRLQPVCLGYD